MRAMSPMCELVVVRTRLLLSSATRMRGKVTQKTSPLPHVFASLIIVLMIPDHPTPHHPHALHFYIVYLALALFLLLLRVTVYRKHPS